MNPLQKDLEHILSHTEDLWGELRGARIFITGGTGFFGTWLLESFAWAHQKLQLDARAVVLTRDPRSFRAKAPHLEANPAISLHEGDFQTFRFPEAKCSHILHVATATPSSSGASAGVALFDANLAGTRRVLEFANHADARKLLFTSSGAVYGRQPAEVTHVPEDYAGAPSTLDSGSAYGESKRVSEFLCAAAAQAGDIDVCIARCFAFAGPHLPLDANYAIGNFTRDALRGGPIQVGGDGTPYRSHLYAADLAIWLWTILLRGRTGTAYNVGSDADLTIADLARTVAEVVSPGAAVTIAQAPDPAKQPQRYVPSIQKARSELGLEPWIGLGEAIARMAAWNRSHKQ
jgi:dTDP-glucose 4,6-dehydratase